MYDECNTYFTRPVSDLLFNMYSYTLIVDYSL